MDYLGVRAKLLETLFNSESNELSRKDLAQGAFGLSDFEQSHTTVLNDLLHSGDVDLRLAKGGKMIYRLTVKGLNVYTMQANITAYRERADKYGKVSAFLQKYHPEVYREMISYLGERI